MSDMINFRGRSASQTHSSTNKFKFVTKIKPRNGNRSVLDASYDTGSQSNNSLLQTQKRSYIYPNSSNDQEDFNRTSASLKGANFKQHDPELCVCKDCLCGRHFCKMNNIKPDIPKHSIYKLDFSKKKPIQNKINISKNYDKLDGPHL